MVHVECLDMDVYFSMNNLRNTKEHPMWKSNFQPFDFHKSLYENEQA
jgi:hypothetical protein